MECPTKGGFVDCYFAQPYAAVVPLAPGRRGAAVSDSRFDPGIDCAARIVGRIIDGGRGEQRSDVVRPDQTHRRSRVRPGHTPGDWPWRLHRQEDA